VYIKSLEKRTGVKVHEWSYTHVHNEKQKTIFESSQSIIVHFIWNQKKELQRAKLLLTDLVSESFKKAGI